MKTIIVGGGLGGLSAAIYLAKEGVDVHLYEKNEHFGGKMMPINQDGYHFDFGPNTITMPHVFKDVLSQAGLNPNEELPFLSIENHTRNQFTDGTTIDFSSNPSFMKEQLREIDPKAASHYDEFLQEVEKLYHLSNRYFLNRTFSSWKDYLSPPLARAMTKVRPLQSMDRFFKHYFNHPQMVQALNRYATYIGSSPYASPATFAMIAHLELSDGVYYVRGGNTKIADSFVKAAKKLGVHLHSSTEVEKLIVKRDRISGVKLSTGEKVEADRVIVNGDLLEALPALLTEEERPSFKDKKIRSVDPSTSAFVITAGLDTRLDSLNHHHVLFSSNYQEEFQTLRQGEYSFDPTIYISTSSKTDPDVSPKGDNCFILVNAPADQEHNAPSASAYRDLIYEKLYEAGLPLAAHVKNEQTITPGAIQHRFRAFHGAIYGPSSNSRVQAFRRPFNQSSDYKNLYFCGGSTHPGGGSPMVVLSGQNVADKILGKIRFVE
ncbi:phytoene desaturase [Halobacillus andaensis]|uniref:4,4'-diaponeurosporene oxygenase n=1 Tax=Halobacillus andaensis TaxID=1176239 RepID=A0A917AZD5_HALAA|nr:phytoene desaturase family protein [Halobacillus andaensis]MBP2003690.1 phytoene desaturase [Halobacillus andaensis]GGF12503.1 phytoene desaturase [Halobacillus andaensis]